MPSPYTESFTGTVARVWHGDAKHAHQIIMRDDRRITKRFYSWSDWVASFCDQASKSETPITLDFSATAWGKLIMDLDYAQDPDPELHAS